MKTKIFLMAIIACLVSYIIFDSSDQKAHSHSPNVDDRVVANDPTSAPPKITSRQAQSINSGKLITSKAGVSPHEHSVGTDLDNHEHNAVNENHHLIPAHIKKVLCVDDNDPLSCTVNMEKNLESILLDSTGNMLADEITTVLESKNFQQVIESLSSQKETNEAFIREDDYQLELNKLVEDYNVVSSPLYCSETICAMTIEYKDLGSSRDFYSKFFNKSDKGNIFLSQQDAKSETSKIERVMFFPGNNNGVLIPLSN